MNASFSLRADLDAAMCDHDCLENSELAIVMHLCADASASSRWPRSFEGPLRMAVLSDTIGTVVVSARTNVVDCRRDAVTIWPWCARRACHVSVPVTDGAANAVRTSLERFPRSTLFDIDEKVWHKTVRGVSSRFGVASCDWGALVGLCARANQHPIPSIGTTVYDSSVVDASAVPQALPLPTTIVRGVEWSNLRASRAGRVDFDALAGTVCVASGDDADVYALAVSFAVNGACKDALESRLIAPQALMDARPWKSGVVLRFDRGGTRYRLARSAQRMGVDLKVKDQTLHADGERVPGTQMRHWFADTTFPCPVFDPTVSLRSLRDVLLPATCPLLEADRRELDERARRDSLTAKSVMDRARENAGRLADRFVRCTRSLSDAGLGLTQNGPSLRLKFDDAREVRIEDVSTAHFWVAGAAACAALCVTRMPGFTSSAIIATDTPASVLGDVRRIFEAMVSVRDDMTVIVRPVAHAKAWRGPAPESLAVDWRACQNSRVDLSRLLADDATVASSMVENVRFTHQGAPVSETWPDFPAERDERIFDAILSYYGGSDARRGSDSRQVYAKKIVCNLRTLGRLSANAPRDVDVYNRHDVPDGSTVARAMVRDPLRLFCLVWKKYENPHTCHNMLVTIKVALYRDTALGTQSTREFWSSRAMRAQRRVESVIGDNILTSAQKAKIPDLDVLEIHLARMRADRSYERSERASLEYLIILISLRVPPKRNDWGALRIVRSVDPQRDMLESLADDSIRNFVMLPSRESGRPATLVLVDYKTSKTYGGFRGDLPAEVTEAIHTSLDLFPRDHLFRTRTKKVYSNDSYGNLFINVMKKYQPENKRVNSSGLRKAWVIRHYARTGTHASNEALAADMLHSFTTQQKFYKLVADDCPASDRSSHASPSPEAQTSSDAGVESDVHVV